MTGPPMTGHFKVEMDEPRGKAPFQPSAMKKKTEREEESKPTRPFSRLEHDASSTPPSKFAENIALRRNIYDGVGKEIAAQREKRKQDGGEEGITNGVASGEPSGKTIEELAKEPKQAHYCYTCGQDCTRVRFHRAKTSSAPKGSSSLASKYDLCPNCYREGRHTNDLVHEDFVMLEDPNHTHAPDRDSPWADHELLLLLEALEEFDDNWTSIAQHVGTRSREECVMKFLQLEIEDKYLDEGEGNMTVGALNYGRIPFGNMEHPIMSVVSFLAGMSDPATTATMAGRSVDQTVKVLRRQLENGTSAPASLKDKEKDGSKPTSSDQDHSTGSEDTMDVDPASTSAVDPISELDKSADSITRASNIALTGSATRAGALAAHEERESTRLLSSATNVMLDKFELKMAQFAEIEQIQSAERLELEAGQQKLFLDRLALRRRIGELQDELRRLQIDGGANGMGRLDGKRGMPKLGLEGLDGKGVDDIGPLGAGDEGFRKYEI